MIEKLPAMYFFPNDYIASTRSLTMAQRGIYTDLLFFSHTMNGKGLPCNIDELCKLIFQMTFDLEEIEKNRADLTYVLERKFYVKNDRYYNKRQQIEFVKGIELSNKRSEARKKKKFDKVLSNQNTISVDKDKDTDKDVNDIFIYVWDNLKVRRGSKKLALEKFKKFSKTIDPKIIVSKFNNLCENASDDKYIPHFATWLNQERFNDEEIFSIDNFKKLHNIDANFVQEKDGLLYFTTKEGWGIMDWIYDKQGNSINPKDLNGKKEKKAEETKT